MLINTNIILDKPVWGIGFLVTVLSTVLFVITVAVSFFIVNVNGSVVSLTVPTSLTVLNIIVVVPSSVITTFPSSTLCHVFPPSVLYSCSMSLSVGSPSTSITTSSSVVSPLSTFASIVGGSGLELSK